MQVWETIEGVREDLVEARSRGARIGLVPTMGALHAGHGSLIDRAVRECDAVVVSIFVNPLQFGPNEDLTRYPKTLEDDLAGCRQRGVAIVFSPSVHEMYGEGSLTTVHVGQLTTGLCGRSRPGHFDGVCTVVAKLLNIIEPTAAYFGEKDYQQLTVIRRMVRDLSMPVEIVGCPIVREDSGLALSSRNAYLSEDARERASVVHAALHDARETFRSGERDVAMLVKAITGRLRDAGANVEYVEIVDVETLEPLSKVDRAARCCVAVRMDSTRLIDNIALDAGQPLP